MAKFCTRCGAPLREGETCPCQQPVDETTIPKNNPQYATPTSNPQYSAPTSNPQFTAPKSNPQFDQVKNNSMKAVKGLWSHLLELIRSPITGGKEFIKSGNVNMAMGIIVVQSIFSGLFSIIVLCKLNNFMQIFSELFSSSKKSIFDTSSSSLSDLIALYGNKFSVIKGFFITVILSLLFSLVITGILYLLIKLFHGNTNFKTQLCLAATRSAVLIPSIVVSILIFALNPIYGSIFFILTSVLGFIVLSMNLSASADISMNCIPYILFITYILLILICCFVARRVYILYLPSKIAHEISKAKNSLYDASILLEDLFK